MKISFWVFGSIATEITSPDIATVFVTVAIAVAVTTLVSGLVYWAVMVVVPAVTPVICPGAVGGVPGQTAALQMLATAGMLDLQTTAVVTSDWRPVGPF